MSKPRKTPIPLPGSAPKKAAIPPPKSTLSQEFVGSSDDSSSETEARPQKKTPVQIAVHRPKGGEKAKENKKPKKGKEEPAKSSAKSKPSPKKPAPTKITAEEDGTTTSSSSEESEDEPETDIRKAQTREKAKEKKKAASTSSSDVSSDSSDESEEEAPPKAAPVQSQTTPTNTHNVDLVAARPYVPPKDFVPASTNRAASSPSTAVLDNLQGKQIWHITAPANISLKDLKQLAMEQATEGEAILKHKNASYGFLDVAKEDSGSQEVIVPRQNGYKAASSRISHTFHLREIVDLPSSVQADLNTGSEAAASITQSTIRAPPRQVKGLKMRFFPSGVTNQTPVTLGSSDDEEDDRPAPTAGLGVPNGIHLPVRSEKRKHGDLHEDERVESPAKKHKKHRTPEELKKREEKRAKKEKKRAKAKS
ncbi:hypothetical protein DM02DRAFT_567511 [Periconia macrospinosa]|uniref:Uncharacterized protein n=1 Tax=Periconia macrospinosa TaxID=97972 RepID=A0A2V1DIB7_9PLEO|nr:hypothetical protein DM02DRAFT_567511 [Periconia macrospinosa]